MKIGMVIFSNMTQLDFTGPYEVFRQFKDSKIYVIAKTLDPVVANGGLRFLPDTTIETAPQLDLLFVPGGPGTEQQIEDIEVLKFLRKQAQHATYITSVCTGALILAAAGLLQGYRATTHWLSLDLLKFFGVTPVSDRVVIDRNRITGGGVTAGIDFALYVAEKIFGQREAQKIQLFLEYNPAPPFHSGHPSIADPKLVAEIRAERASLQKDREEQAKRISKLFCNSTTFGNH